MAIATAFRFSFFFLLLLIILGTFHYRPSYAVVSGNFQTISSNDGSDRNLLSVQSNNNQRPDCSEIASKSQCFHSPNCRWCRSQVLDDMCFSKSEAWRLPSQVFSCNLGQS
ncbi:unnamed protein product [Ilex paraguariensis]|uniref:Uncharacterized protein n=1 Tax=Ilex paraguariensis TaxID=185542 RepID=A0ABC8SBU2_9AQUA